MADEGSGLTYEQARDELETIVAQLEAGGLTLEESLALWERGEAMSRVCQAWLEAASGRLEQSDGEDDEDDEGEAAE
jgi:exodeoxyribonuclease VII small subunit